MRTKILAASALATAIISGTAFAQTPKAEEDHSAHHSAGSASAASASAPSAKPSPEAFNQQMKAMQDMHQKMQAAKSPAERAKLMEDHMPSPVARHSRPLRTHSPSAVCGFRDDSAGLPAAVAHVADLGHVPSLAPDVRASRHH